jgi:acetyl-CoA carboxylase biotin carboxyl carrier protein
LDLKAIKQVVEMMKRSEISEFEIEEEGFKLRLSRKSSEAQIVHSAPIIAPSAMPVAPQAPAAATNEPANPPVEEADIFVIKSPMVGTFYRASSPESPPFVKIGDKVTTDSVVCIIEAMKVMNEIHAETTGTVTEVLVENADAVEYGQPLFKVKTT